MCSSWKVLLDVLSVLWQETGSCVLCPYRSLFTLRCGAKKYIFIINIATAVHRSTVMTQEEKETIVHFICFLCFTGSIVNTVTELHLVLFYLC